MCFIKALLEAEEVEDTPSTMSYVETQPRCWWGQDWILPRKIILAILLASLVLLLIGIILLAVGLSSAGGVLTGLGGCGLMVLLLLGLHAYCCRYTKDVHTQTGVQAETGDDIPSYAVIQKPSSLKRSDSGSKRNGRTLEKHVTLAPDIEGRDRAGQVTVAPSTGPGHVETVHQIPIQHASQSQMYSQQNSFAQQTPIYKPSGQMYAPPAPMIRPFGQTYAPPAAQYPMQVYPVKAASSTSSSIRYGFDDDYDNPAETTPMLNQPPAMSSASYSNQYRSSSSSQQTSISCKGGQSSVEFDIPEPAPLQYPSAKRPMTFEQTSSSKMSVYDNITQAFPETGAV